LFAEVSSRRELAQGCGVKVAQLFHGARDLPLGADNVAKPGASCPGWGSRTTGIQVRFLVFDTNTSVLVVGA